jgi:hypothetical protein
LSKTFYNHYNPIVLFTKTNNDVKMIDNLNKELITRLVKDLHLILFSEEYDYMFHSIADIEDRKGV